jgi:hypothetical protein
MSITLEISETVLRQVEGLAKHQGLTSEELIRQIIDAHLSACHGAANPFGEDVPFPLIAAPDTGPIGPFHGSDIDELLFGDHLAS